MRRRSFVAALAAVLAMPGAAGAQQAGKVYRVGVLTLAPLAARPQQWEAFRQGMRDHGYLPGQNVVLEFRSADSKTDRLPGLMAEMIQANMDVIVVSGTEATQAAQKATRTVPIVMSNTGDPVGAGVVASLARPGGNITGLSLLATELSAKRLELLKEILPGVARVAVLWNPNNASVSLKFKETAAAARVLGLHLQSLEVRQAGISRDNSRPRRAPAPTPWSRPTISSCRASGRRSPIWPCDIACRWCPSSGSSPRRAAFAAMVPV